MANEGFKIPSVSELMTEDPAKKAARLARIAELEKILNTNDTAAAPPGIWDSAKAGLFDITGAGLSGLGDMTGSKTTERVGDTFSKWARELAPEGPKTTLGEIAYYGAGMLPIMAGAALGGWGAAGLAGLGGVAETAAGIGAGAEAAQAAIGTAGTLGALGGASVVDYPIQYGGNIEEQKQANNGVIKDRGAAALAAIPQTVLDSLLEGFAAFKLFGLGTKTAIKAGDKLPGLLTKVVKDTATGAAIEVPTEIGQQVLQRIQAGEDPTSEEAMNEYATIARVSATMGGLAGGVTGTFEHFQNSDQLKRLNAEKARKDKEEEIKKSLADRIAAMEAKQAEEKGNVARADAAAAQPKLLGYDPNQYDDLSPGQINRSRYPLSPEMAAGVHEGPTWNIKDLGDIGEKINYNRQAMGLDPTDRATVLDLRSLNAQDRERAFAIINGVGPAGKPVENKPYTQKHRDDLLKHMGAAGREMTLDELIKAARINKIAEVGDTVDITDDQGRKLEVTEPQKVTGLVETASGTHVILNNVKNRPIPLKNAIPTAPTVSESSPTAVDNPLVPNQPAAEPFTPESDAQRKQLAGKLLAVTNPKVEPAFKSVEQEKQEAAQKKTSEHAARQWAAAQIIDSLRKSNAALNEQQTNQSADNTAKLTMRAVDAIQKKTVQELKKVFLGNANQEYINVFNRVMRHMADTKRTPSQIQYTDVYPDTGIAGRDAQTMTPTRGTRAPKPTSIEQAPPLKPEDVEYEGMLFTKNAGDEWSPLAGSKDTTITQKGYDGWRIVRKRAADGEFDYAVDSETVDPETRKELGKKVYDTEQEAAQALVQFKDNERFKEKKAGVPYAPKIAPVPLRPTTGVASPVAATTTKVAESPLAPVSQIESAAPLTAEQKKQAEIESRAQSFLNSTQWKPYTRLVGGVQQLVGNERVLDGWRIVRIRDLKTMTDKYGIDFVQAPESLRNKMRAGVYATEKEAAIALVKAKEFYTAAKTQNQADQKVATPAPVVAPATNQMPAAPAMKSATPAAQPVATPAQPVGQFQAAAMNLKNSPEAIAKFGASLPTIAKQIVKDFRHGSKGPKWSGYTFENGMRILSRFIQPTDKTKPPYQVFRVDFPKENGKPQAHVEVKGNASGGNEGAKLRALDVAMNLINNPAPTSSEVKAAEASAQAFADKAATAKPENQTVVSSTRATKKEKPVVTGEPLPDLGSLASFNTGWSPTVYEDKNGNKKTAYKNGPYKIIKLVSERTGKVYAYQLRQSGIPGRKHGIIRNPMNSGQNWNKFFINNDPLGVLEVVKEYAYKDATANSSGLGQQNDIIQPGINPIYQADLDALAAKNEAENPTPNQTLIKKETRTLAERAAETAKQYQNLDLLNKDDGGYDGLNPADYQDYDPNNMNSIGNIDPNILGKTTLDPKMREVILRRLDDFYRDYIFHENKALQSERLVDGSMVATDRVAENAARATYKKMRDMFFSLYPGKPDKEIRPLFIDWQNSMKPLIAGAEALDAPVTSTVTPASSDIVPANATKQIFKDNRTESQKKEDAEWDALKKGAPANQYVVSPLVDNILNRSEPVRKPTVKQRVVVPDNEAATQLINDLIEEGVIVKTEKGYKYADQAERARDILKTIDKTQRVSSPPPKAAVRSTFEVESLPTDDVSGDPTKQYALKVEKQYTKGETRWLRSGKEGKPLLFQTAKAAKEYLERFLKMSDALYAKEMAQYKADVAKYEAGNWEGDPPKPPVYKWVGSKITPVTVGSETTTKGKVKSTKQTLTEDKSRQHWAVVKTGFDSSGKRVSKIPVSFHATEQEAKENADNHRWNEREFSISKYDWTSENSAALMRQSAPATDAMAMVMDTVPEGKAEFTPEQANKIAEEELKDKAFRQPDAYLKKTYGPVFDAVDAAIKEAHAKMGLDKLGIKVGLYGNVNKNAEGLYSAKRKLIALSMSAHIDPKLSTAENVRRVVSTFTHEAFHAFEDLGIITSEEFDILTNDVKTRKPPGGKYTFMQMARMNKSYQAQFNPDSMIQNPDTMARATKNIANRGQVVNSKSLAEEIMRLSDDGFRGEAIANYAAYWARNDLNATPKAKGIFGKIINFLMNIFKGNRKAGFNGEKVFSDMTSGNFASRTPVVNQLDGIRFSFAANDDHTILVHRVEPSVNGEHERVVTFNVMKNGVEDTEVLRGYGRFVKEFSLGPLGELQQAKTFYLDFLNTPTTEDKNRYKKLVSSVIGALHDNFMVVKIIGPDVESFKTVSGVPNWGVYSKNSEDYDSKKSGRGLGPDGFPAESPEEAYGNFMTGKLHTISAWHSHSQHEFNRFYPTDAELDNVDPNDYLPDLPPTATDTSGILYDPDSEGFDFDSNADDGFKRRRQNLESWGTMASRINQLGLPDRVDVNGFSYDVRGSMNFERLNALKNIIITYNNAYPLSQEEYATLFRGDIPDTLRGKTNMSRGNFEKLMRNMPGLGMGASFLKPVKFENSDEYKAFLETFSLDFKQDDAEKQQEAAGRAEKIRRIKETPRTIPDFMDYLGIPKMSNDDAVDWRKELSPEMIESFADIVEVFNHGEAMTPSDFFNLMNGVIPFKMSLYDLRGTHELFQQLNIPPDQVSIEEDPDISSYYDPNGQLSADNILKNDFDYGANLDMEMPEISNWSDSVGNRVRFGGSHLHQTMIDRERAYTKVLETFQWFARKMTPQVVKKVLGFNSTDINNWVQRIYMAAIDKDIPIGKLVDMIRKKGGYVDESMDPFLQAELKGDEIIPEIERVRREYVDPMLRYMAENDLDVHRVNDYLYARHAPERNELGRKRNAKRIEKMLKAGEKPTDDMMYASGITDEGAGIVMRALQSDGFVKIGIDGKPVSGRLYELGQLFDRLTRETTRIRIEHGLLPPMEELLNGKNATNFEFYAPLFSNEMIMGEEFLDTSTMARTAGKYQIKGLESKHITGRHTKAGMIIESAILQNHESIIRGKRANVGQALNNMYESDPSLFMPIMRKVDAPPTRKVLTADGFVMEMVDNNYKTMPQYFVTKVDGKEVVFEFAVDESTNRMTPQAAMLSRALRGFNKTQDVNGFVKVLQGLNHFLTKANTAWNPEFTITNLIRDLGLAMFNVEQHQLPGIRKDIMSNWKTAYNSVWRYDAKNEIDEAYMRINPVTGTYNKDPKDWTMDETVHAFRRMGGMTQYYGKLDMKSVMKDLHGSMDALTGKETKPHMVLGAMKKAVGFVEHWNTAVEQAIRVATFKAMIDRGVSPVKATSASKNLTVNFNKGGEQKILLNAMYLFYNASIRGSVTLMDAMLHSKKLRKTAVAITAMGFLADQLAAAMSDEDKDGTLAWDNLKQWKKESAINIPIGGGQYFSIPLPWGLSFFWNNGRAVSDAMRTGNAKKNIGSMMSGLVSNFSPIGSVENVANFFAPTILDPIIAVNSNTNWDNAPIQPENLPFGPQKPNSQLYWNSTSATMKDTAAILNSITGGDENLAGWGDISPNILEYWSDFMLGGTGMFVLRTKDFFTDALPRMINGEASEWNEIPFARKVFAGTGIRTAQEKYQENLKNATTYKGALGNAMERGNAPQAIDYANRFGKEIGMSPFLTKMNSQRSDLRKMSDIVDHSDLPPAYKASIDRVLNDARNNVVWDTNRAYNTVVNGGKK